MIGTMRDGELVRRLLVDGYGYSPDLEYEVRGRSHKVYAWKPGCPRNFGGRGRLYFGRIESDGLRLSIEGSFLVGPRATKNVVVLDDRRAMKYLSGESVEINEDVHGWVIVRWRDYYLGSGKGVGGLLLNYVPKERRLRVQISNVKP